MTISAEVLEGSSVAIAPRTRSVPRGCKGGGLRMLYFYRRWNSGTNQAVLEAWRRCHPEDEVTAIDVDTLLEGGSRTLIKLASLPRLLRQGGLAAIAPGWGRWGDAIKRSARHARRVSHVVARIQQSANYDISLSMGTTIPVLHPKRPHFVYTDHTIRANLHYVDGERKVDLWRECLPFEEDLIRRARMVFTMSRHVSRSLVEQYGLPLQKVMQVNAGCNTPSPPNLDPRRFEHLRILFIGARRESKGGPTLVKAFRKVRQRLPGASLTIVGCTPPASGPGIHVVGRASQEEVSSYLGRAACFCMPSRWEPFGIAYLEAMRAGLPVIASDLGAAPDFVIDGETGYRVDPADDELLAARLEELLRAPSRCREIGERGRALVQSQYTWERTVGKMRELIQDCVAGLSARHQETAGQM